MRRIFRLSLLAASVALLWAPHETVPQAAGDDRAARTLLGTNLAQALMHPPGGEDADFFTSKGGVPNLFFLVDSSGSMERLPPDGPATYGKTSPTADPPMPPGVYLDNPTSNTAANTARAARTILGCGLDPVSAADPAFVGNPVIQHLQNRKFYPPCAKDEGIQFGTDPLFREELVAAKYAGHPGLVAGGADYAQQSARCPYYTSSDSQAVWPANRGGYDPDFYNEAPNNTQIQYSLWVKDLVYHDSVLLTNQYARQSSQFGHNFGKGWTASAPPQGHPARAAGGGYASIDQFCAEQGTTALANGQIPAEVCKTCLKQAGWYYDGVILSDTMDGTSGVKRYPSLWYTGNYLSFFPPKFVIMRKIVKDVIATQSKIRMGLGEFGASGLGMLKEFNPTCAHPDSSFDSNRGAYVNLLNGMSFSGGTPLAYALFDVGRFYHSPGLPWFGNAWEKTGNLWESSANSNDYAICYSCQMSNIVLLTDGIPNASDGSGLPPGPATKAQATGGAYAGATSTGIRGVSVADCPSCGAFSGTNDYKNNLARVAWYLHNFDLRDNGEATKDCKQNGGRQTLDVYTVGYSTRALEDANKILAGAAKEGGGIFVAAENPQLLKDGLNKVILEINTRSTSFSVATVSNLQTATGHSVAIPRFDPTKSSALWQGHLYRYELWSEFVNECDPSKPAGSQAGCCLPNTATDYDCDGKCQSVYLQDADGDFVQEGGDGLFYENDPVGRAACAQAPMCSAKGFTCGAVGGASADPWWDAGETLKRRDWRTRRVFTVVDVDSNGRLDEADGNLELKADDATAKVLLPYLGNRDNRVCEDLANRIETAGDPVTATVVRTDELECAKSVVRWVLGADVFNEAGRRATDDPPWPPLPADPALPPAVADPSTVPPTAANLPVQDALPDRPFKLGDVFHSSPVMVNAPAPSTSIIANLGLDPQILRGLWMAGKDETPTAEKEYDLYAAHYYGRRKVILVGSNDGLVHAFNGGAWHAGKDDKVTRVVDESKPPFNGYYDRSFDPYDPAVADTTLRAQELWAFLPPDMIGKLPQAFKIGAEHQLFVDGTAMVRDVWADGTANAMGRVTRPDDVKQHQEFHTVAVFGERRGGTHYFALDVTEATELSDDPDFVFPRFLWIYPQPDDRATLAQGETYTDFLPVPPPIGPVRIKADANSGPPLADTPKHGGVPYHERWIAFLSGGYDPHYVRGRGVHMVDAWTGKEYFDFSYPYAGGVAADDPRWHLRYPIASTVGMVQWGPGSRRENGLNMANNLFFDTATFGDTGGQLWVVRFHDPGELDSDGKATNWTGARVFQMGGRTNESMGYAHPFFYITANVAMPDQYTYRVYLGTGDRFNLLDTNGGLCGPDNLRACAQRGCTVNVELPANFAGVPELGRIGGSQREVGRGDLTTTGAVGAPYSGTIVTRARAVVNGCPADLAASFTKDVTVTCAPDTQGRWGCTNTDAYGNTIELSNGTSPPVTRNWYFSLKVWDDDPSDRVPFTTVADAKKYDDARYWIRDTGLISQVGGISIMAASTPNPPATATATTPGWAIYYDHAPTAVADGHTYTVNAIDERTSSVSAVGGGAITWNSIQPASGIVTSTSGSCFASKCSGENRRVAYHYAAHPMTGGSVLKDEFGNPTRARVGNTLVPAQGDQTTVFVNQKGQVQVGLTVINPEKGAASIAASDPTDAVKELGWIEVSRDTHACRHAASADQAICR